MNLVTHLVPADDGGQFEHSEEPKVRERRVVAETSSHGLETGTSPPQELVLGAKARVLFDVVVRHIVAAVLLLKLETQHLHIVHG